MMQSDDPSVSLMADSSLYAREPLVLTRYEAAVGLHSGFLL